MMHRFRRSAVSCLIVAGTAVISACGVPRPARNGAQLLAAYTSHVNAMSLQFAEKRTALDRARRANIDQLEQSAVELEQFTSTQVKVWDIAGLGGRADLYRGVRDATEDVAKETQALQSLRDENARIEAATQSAVRVRSKELGSTAAALGQLGETPSLREQVEQDVRFVQAVQTSLKESNDKADEQAGAATKAVDKKAKDHAAEKAKLKDTMKVKPKKPAAAPPVANPPAPAPH